MGLLHQSGSPRPKSSTNWSWNQYGSPDCKPECHWHGSGDAQHGNPNPGGWVPTGVTGKLRYIHTPSAPLEEAAIALERDADLCVHGYATICG